MYFTATNNHLNKTQQLLNSAQIEEQEYIEEQLEHLSGSKERQNNWTILFDMQVTSYQNNGQIAILLYEKNYYDILALLNY